MKKDFSYGFWIWSNKLNGVLSMLSHLADYELSDDEREAIAVELSGTNDEKDIWGNYELMGNQYSIALELAYDAEEGPDMIHLKIETSSALREKLEALDLFQSMFKELEEIRP